MATSATRQGQFDLRQDDDYFRVNLTAGTRYFFTMDGTGAEPVEWRQLLLTTELGYAPGSPGASGEGYLKLDISFEPRDSLGDFLLGGPAQFVVTPAKTGTYYLLASGYGYFGADTGSYAVSVADVALDDHSDLAVLGTRLVAGTAVNGQFDLRHDDDYFRVDLAAGGRYLFTMSAAGASPTQARELTLSSPANPLLRYATELDSLFDPGEPAEFVFSAPASGTYYLLASKGESYALTGTDSGTYSVVYRQVALDDHSDLPALGTALAVGATASGQFDLRQDDDYFRIELAAGARYVFTMSAAGASPSGSLQLTLSDPGGQVSKADFSSSGSALPASPAQFVFTAPNAGTYTLLANRDDAGALAGGGRGTYSVGVVQVALDDHSDLAQQGTMLAVGASLAGRFDQRHDDDYFRVDLAAGSRYLFKLAGAGAAPADALSLGLYDADGVSTLKWDSVAGVPGSSAAEAQFAFTASRSGTHVLLANHGTGAAGGTYSVSVVQRPLDDHADVRALGTVLPVGSSRTGEFDLRGDDDYFRVDLVGGGRYLFTMSASGPSPVQSRQLTLSDGDNLLAKADLTYDSEFTGPLLPRDGSARFVFTAPSSGTYLLLANAGQGFQLTGTDTGTYTVGVEQVALDDHSDLRQSGTWLLDVPIKEIIGTPQDDTLNGSSGPDEIFGLAGNDVLSGKGGADLLDGGEGSDAAAYAGTFAAFVIARVGGQWRLFDRTGAEGIDDLISIEKVQFADKAFDLVNPPRQGVPAYGQMNGFLFDAVFYLLDNPELVPAQTLATALQHYFATGAAQGKSPNSWFDASYYENRWPDLKAGNFSDDILFMHYNLYGVWEGRSAGPAFDQFDGNRYLADNPDVAAYVDAYIGDFLGSRTNGAIAHYVIYGQHEQRLAYDLVGQPISMDYTIEWGG